MRTANIVLGVLMLVFAALQYNDPDPHVWVPVYALAGGWALAAGLWLPRVASTPGMALLGACVLGYLALVVFYWPRAEGFWQQEVWWNDEEAREGMGAMIALAVVACAALAALRARSRRS